MALKLQLDMETAVAQEKMRRAVKDIGDEAKKLVDSQESAMVRASRAWDGWAQSVTGGRTGMALAGAAAAGLAVAVAGATAAVVRSAVQLSAYGDALDEMSDRTGLSVEALSELDHGFNKSGASLQLLEGSIAGVTKRLAGVERDAKIATQAFADYGIEVRDASGQLRSMEELLPEMADAVARAGSDTDQAAAAVRLFGDAGRQLLPVLKGGADGLEAMRVESRALGLSMSGEDATAAAALQDAIADLQAAFEGLRREALLPILPHLTAFTEKTGLAVQALQGLTSADVARWLKITTMFMNPMDMLGGFVLARKELDALGDDMERIAREREEEAERAAVKGFIESTDPKTVAARKDAEERAALAAEADAQAKASAEAAKAQAEERKRIEEELGFALFRQRDAFAELDELSTRFRDVASERMETTDAELSRLLDEGAALVALENAERERLRIARAIGDANAKGAAFDAMAAATIQSAIVPSMEIFLDRSTNAADKWREFASSILPMILRQLIEAQVTAGLLSSTAGGWLGVGAGVVGLIGGLFHEGGTVGETSPPQRAVDPRGGPIPRLHGGLAGDEFLAILQRGERVLPEREAAPLERAGMLRRDSRGRPRANVGGGGGSNTINLVIQGNVIGEDDYVQTRLIPSIRRAVRDLGARLS